MGRRNGAISLGVSALIVIALILIAGFGLFLYSNFNTTTAPPTIPPTFTSTTSTVTTFSNSSGILTVTEYMIISGYASQNITISGSCTLGGGTLMVALTSTTTTYVTPKNVPSASGTTTVTVTSGGVNSNLSTRVSTTTISKTTSTSACPTIA